MNLMWSIIQGQFNPPEGNSFIIIQIQNSIKYGNKIIKSLLQIQLYEVQFQHKNNLKYHFWLYFNQSLSADLLGYTIYFLISKQNMNNMILNFYQPAQEHPELSKFKEKATTLFQKLNHLQQNSEENKSIVQKSKMQQFNEKENRVYQTIKDNQQRLGKILHAVSDIQKNVQDMKNEEERCMRAIKARVAAVDRQLQIIFDSFQKERIKNQAQLQQFIQSKLQQFILKDKSVWNKGSLIKQDPYIEEIQHAVRQNQKFLDQVGKEAKQLRKDIYNSLKECTKLIQQEAHKNQEQEILSFIRLVHLDISAKLNGLKDQRQKTQQRVVNTLDKVVSTYTSIQHND